MKGYIKAREKLFGVTLLFLVFLNVYFLVICSSSLYVEDLLYLDVLLMTAYLLWSWRDYGRWTRDENRRLGREAERKNDEALIQQLQEQLSEMSDYTAKWAHEVKLPLAALKLMNERNQDEELKKRMENSLERLSVLLNTMLMSSKLRGMENDIQIERISLKDAVHQSIRNQSYFLIKEGFEIREKLEKIRVYSDERWLVYMLDQLIGNAVKYHRENPVLCFGAETMEKGVIRFWVEDHGIGIHQGDLPYIFDKGYIGNNLRNGDYRSTGMGLYFVRKIALRLGIDIKVESVSGSYTRFSFFFWEAADKI